jgi:prefoldin alpha subunit
MMGEREIKEATTKLMQYKSRFEEIEEQQAILAEEAKIVITSLEQNERARAVLENYAKGSKDDELLVHLGGEVFMPGKIKDRRSAVVGVGSDVYIQMEVDKALKICEKRSEELKALFSKVEEGQRRYDEEKTKIASAYNSLANKLENNAQFPQKGFAA